MVLLSNGKWAFRDTKGRLSEGYKSIIRYSDGFGKAYIGDFEWLYRDENGNLLSKSEYNKIKDFWNGKKDVYNLETEVFGNEKLLALTIKKVKDDARRFIKLSRNEEELKASGRYYRETMEYILSKAYEIKKEKQLEAQKRIKEQQNAGKIAASQQKMLEEFNLQ